MRTIGLDLSLTQTGVAVVNESGRLIGKHIFGYDLKKAGEAEKIVRHISICNEIVGLVKTHDYNGEGPPAVAIEGYAFNSPYGREALAELHGVVRLQLFLALKVTALRIPPASARKAIGLDIKSKSVRRKVDGRWVLERRKVRPAKEQVREQLEARGMRFGDNELDVMDAYVVALARQTQGSLGV